MAYKTNAESEVVGYKDGKPHGSKGKQKSPETRERMRLAQQRRQKWDQGYSGGEASYDAVHQRLTRVERKSICAICGRPERTEMALIHGRGDRTDAFGKNRGRVYSIDLDDYIEMCVPCHRTYDKGTGKNYARYKRYVESVDALRATGMVDF